MRYTRSTVRSFGGSRPLTPRFTFGSLAVAGVPTDVQHYVRRRRANRDASC